MKLFLPITVALALLGTPKTSAFTFPEECLAKVSSLSVCMASYWELCTSCMSALTPITNRNTACDTVEHLQCEIGGCCPCSEQEITQCVLDNTGEECGDIDCGFNVGGQEVDDQDGDTTASDNGDTTCGFCPGGYTTENENAMYGDVVTFNGTLTLTCGEFHRVLEKIPDGLCTAAQGDILDRPDESYAHQCGYCVLPTEGVDGCTFCADGLIPTEPVDKEVNDNGETCGFFQYVALYQEAGSNVCSQMQQIGVDSCGCTTGAAASDTTTTSAGPQLGVLSFALVGVVACVVSLV